MGNKILKKLEGEFYESGYQIELLEDAQYLTKEQLISKYIELEKRVYVSEYYRDLLFSHAAIDLFYFHPEWDGSDYSDEKGEQIIMRMEIEHNNWRE